MTATGPQNAVMDYSNIPLNPKDDRLKVNPYEEDEWVDDELVVPSTSELNVCQWIVIGILWLILLYLASFIIYISATWDKDRTNEYT